MIRRTIKEHLNKEMRLRPQGIKVLSLFFIDAVERTASTTPTAIRRRASMRSSFEEEYRRLAEASGLPEPLQGSRRPDRRGRGARRLLLASTRRARWTDTAENNQGNRDNAERAYNLIMRDKEKLLSFETPLKFIFSHSALARRLGQSRTSSRFAPCATWAPNANAGRRSAAACASA